MPPPKRYDEEFKQQAVELLLKSGRPLKTLAEELGVTPWSLRSWKKQYLANSSPTGRARSARTLQDLERQNQTLRREVDQLRQQRDVLKKAVGILSEEPERYAVVKGLAAEFPVHRLCETLEVSASGYYAWRHRKPSLRQQQNQQLIEQIRQVHALSRNTYGSPRVTRQLSLQGVLCNRKRVARLMREQAVVGVQETPGFDHAPPIADMTIRSPPIDSPPTPRRLGSETSPTSPTREGWLYLAALMNLESRRIVGWALADHLRGELPLVALDRALAAQRVPPGWLHHSDRGSQYASSQYRERLIQAGLMMSMSGTGHCYDNAAMESFWATLKTELLAGRVFESRRQARMEIFDYIEVFYNRQRLHSSLGYLSPVDYEKKLEYMNN